MNNSVQEKNKINQDSLKQRKTIINSNNSQKTSTNENIKKLNTKKSTKKKTEQPTKGDTLKSLMKEESKEGSHNH